MRVGSKALRWICPGVGGGLGVLSFQCQQPHGAMKGSFLEPYSCSFLTAHFASCAETKRGPTGPSWENAQVAEKLERNYRNPEVVMQRKRTLEVLALKSGESVLDVGCGPALLVADMSVAVGPQGHAVGIDPSDTMIALGQEKLKSTQNTALRRGSAEKLPFPDNTFDAVTFCQVMSYVPDVPGALREVRRVLVPGGRLLVLDTDWQGCVINAPDKVRAHRVLQSHEDHFLDSTLPRKMPRLLQEAGFQLRDVQGVPMIAAGTIVPEDSWVGQMLFTHMPKNARTHPPSKDVPGDAEGFFAEQSELNRNGELFAAVNRYIFLATA
eukprot:gnl/TRDRNA2_/TRDRNA2_204561_c0_seq1.p1 gnl/TRDRNA2_/TRDRNA2_204561_c0~~gnl/TRDRNA2_/TRDRNA2_204561_c0_seq1.p1  ORF type:complete len:325 (-),score=35.76 gnl/TRDRNA2_/TRDRNA2_204561_c0_seq1:274-1248(-)